MNTRIKLPARLLRRALKVEPLIGGLLTATYVDIPLPAPPAAPRTGIAAAPAPASTAAAPAAPSSATCPEKDDR